MRERGFGRIVAIGSSAGKTGGAKSVAAYGASKAGIMAMAKSIASEYAGTGVTANALAPALDRHRHGRSHARHAREGPARAVRNAAGGRRRGRLPLLDHSSFVTGEVVDVNGGFLID